MPVDTSYSCFFAQLAESSNNRRYSVLYTGKRPRFLLFMRFFGSTQGAIDADERAKATYSSLRTGILSLTPGDNKCRFYCKGANCRFCAVVPNQPNIQAINGLYSTWITDNILAMSRLQQQHFLEFSIIEEFHRNGIKSVINLQEYGEHSFCGKGNLCNTGFSYDPEELMRSGIYYYNFPLPDFEACTSTRLLDIVKVVDFALANGKIAVHCHAGHGRTGMVIASWLMYATGITPGQAVGMVRSRRAKAVQSREQVDTLHRFHALIRTDGGMIIPCTKFTKITEYVKYNQKFLSKPEARLYGPIPKIVYIGMKLVLESCYEFVEFGLQPDEEDYNFHVECKNPKINQKSMDEELLSSQLNEENLEATRQYYKQNVKQGLSVSTMQNYLKKEDFRDLIRLLDLFFHSSFHQLANKEQLETIIDNPKGSNEDWAPTFSFLLQTCRACPKPLHQPMVRLISKWFIRSEVDIPKKILSAM